MTRYNRNDAERLLRMTRCRMQIALDDIVRIRRDVHDNKYLAEAEAVLAKALDAFRQGEEEAADAYGYQINESMPT